MNVVDERWPQDLAANVRTLVEFMDEFPELMATEIRNVGVGGPGNPYSLSFFVEGDEAVYNLWAKALGEARSDFRPVDNGHRKWRQGSVHERRRNIHAIISTDKGGDS